LKVKTTGGFSVGQYPLSSWPTERISRAFGANEIFCYSFLMNTALLFADPNLLHLERVTSERDRVTLIVKTAPRLAPCPQCHSPSAHVHSRYIRRLADLPWLGGAVPL